MRNKPLLAMLLSSLTLLTGCGTYLPCTNVGYMSIRPIEVIDENLNPIEDASIAIYSIIDNSGNFDVIVQNLTDDVLTIDQTKSFFISPSKQSISYYDPTVRTNSNTTATTSGSGKTFNLGGIANAFGVGGVAGALMKATNVSVSNSITNESTYTEVVADLPQVSIGPRGKMAMSKSFKIDWNATANNFVSATPETSPITFSVCITYSFDDGVTFDRIIGEYYCNSKFNQPVIKRQTNDAVRKIIQTKPNATLEPWFIFTNSRSHGIYNLNTFIKYQ